MGLSETRIRQSDYIGRDISSLPDKPALSAQELKERFDAISKEVIAVKHNEAVELLSGPEGAASVMSASGKSVQQELSEAAKLANVLERDNEEAFVPTGDFNPATKGYVDTVAFSAGAVASVFGRAGAIDARKGDYTPEQVGAFSKEETLSEETAAAFDMEEGAVPDDVFAALSGGWRAGRLETIFYAEDMEVGYNKILSLDLSHVFLPDFEKIYVRYQLEAAPFVSGSHSQTIHFRFGTTPYETGEITYMDYSNTNPGTTRTWRMDRGEYNVSVPIGIMTAGIYQNAGTGKKTFFDLEISMQADGCFSVLQKNDVQTGNRRGVFYAMSAHDYSRENLQTAFGSLKLVCPVMPNTMQPHHVDFVRITGKRRES